MRPLRLEMAGFSTYAEHTVVDFTDVELAAFVGPTGSGKSSIIDAITFALYGSVARYDEKAVAPVINQLATEARVRLDFELDGRTYTAARVVRRGKNPQNATTKEARLECGTDVLAADPKTLTAEVERLLGLDFAQFNKTVVLPQGRFADFLHDKPGDRVELLRDVLGLGVYARVGQAARERAKSLTDQATTLESTLDVGPEVSEEHLAELRARVVAIDDAVAAVDTAAPGLEALVEQGRAAIAEADGVEQQLDALAAIEMPDGVEELDAQLQAAADALAAADAASTAAGEAVTAAEAAAGQHRSEEDCRRLLEVHARHTTAAEQRDAAEAALAGAAATLAAAVEAADAARAATQAQRAVVAERQAALEAATAALQALGERGVLEGARDDHLRLAQLEVELADAAQAADAADAAAEMAASAAAAATAARQQAERLAPAVALAAQLHEGDTCPVCEQVVHHLPSDRSHDHQQIDALTAAEVRAEQRRASAERAARSAGDGVLVLRTEQEQVVRRLAGLPDLPTVMTRLDQFEECAAAVASARAAEGEARATLTELESHGSTRVALDAEAAAQQAHARAEAVCEARGEELAASQQALAGVPPAAQLEAEQEVATRLAAELSAARQTAKEADAALRQARTEVEDCRRRDQQARQHLSDVRDQVAALGPPKPGARLAEAWQQMVEWSARTSAEQGQRLAALRATATTAAEEHAAALAALQARAAAAVGAAEAGTVARLQSLLAAARATTDGQAKHLAAELARIAKAREQIDALRTDARVAQLLGDVLKANRFESWLLLEAVEDLVARATVRLHELTGGQYSIVADERAFRIVDHRNADEERDARSLSGGETFLTSLALALALADSTMELAADGSAVLESIFLDEGFGSLDPDTLDVVAGSIEELGASGRMVGIVTHIRELAERMPTRFEVTKGAGGSSVNRVDA